MILLTAKTQHYPGSKISLLQLERPPLGTLAKPFIVSKGDSCIQEMIHQGMSRERLAKLECQAMPP